MKKILYLTPYFPYPPKSGGMESIWTRIKVFSGLKMNIDLLSISNKDITDDKMEAVLKYISSVSYKKRKSGISLITKSVLSIIQKKSLFLSLISNEYKNDVESSLNSNFYDAIICEHTYLAYWFMKEFPAYEKKIVVVVHNLEYEWYKYMFLNERNLLKKLYYYIEQRAFEKYEDAIFKKKFKCLFLSNSEKKNINDKYLNNDESILIPGVTLCKKYHSSLNHMERQPIMLFVARMDSERNISAIKFFIENVFLKIKGEVIDAQLRIVGRGDDGKFKAYINQITKEYNIDFIGEVEDLEEEYINAKIVVLPMLESIGIQTKLFEAINYGSLVVSTVNGVKGSIFDDGKAVVVVDTEDAFADACIGILKNQFNIKQKLEEVEKIFVNHGEKAYMKMLQEFIER